jgi:predicted NAD/FAD-binding protein
VIRPDSPTYIQDSGGRDGWGFIEMTFGSNSGARKIAVIGSGVSGLSAAWLLSQAHDVTLFEADRRLGGHSNTVEAGPVAVDTGFMVYNERTYPNLTALFRHLDIPTKVSDMSFSVSLDGGRLEYAGTDANSLFAQRRNLISPRFWSMLKDVKRFYRDAASDAAGLGDSSLDHYLNSSGYGDAFRDDHLYPMASAIWSTPASEIGACPAAAFIRFMDNHGLLKLTGRPDWLTVEGGSRVYVRKLEQALQGQVLTGCPVRSVRREAAYVEVTAEGMEPRRFDDVVIATHADQALRILADASPQEQRILKNFRYNRNEAVLHSDPALMPSRRKVWSSWNYAAQTQGARNKVSVTYWMNSLQGLAGKTQLFVTLNPLVEPAAGSVFKREMYEHPVFDVAALRAQERLWSLQGVRNTWFCGAYFGAGFHEDGLQAGLAVAEELGGVKRPWSVAEASGRLRNRKAATPQLAIGVA